MNTQLIVKNLDFTYTHEKNNFMLFMNVLLSNSAENSYQIKSFIKVKEIITHFAVLFEDLETCKIEESNISKPNSDELNVIYSSDSGSLINNERYYISSSFKNDMENDKLCWNIYLSGLADVLYPLFEHIMLRFKPGLNEKFINILKQIREQISDRFETCPEIKWKQSDINMDIQINMNPFIDKYDTEYMKKILADKDALFLKLVRKMKLNPFGNIWVPLMFVLTIITIIIVSLF